MGFDKGILGICVENGKLVFNKSTISDHSSIIDDHSDVANNNIYTTIDTHLNWPNDYTISEWEPRDYTIVDNSATKTDLVVLRADIDKKIDNFLKFLTIKGVIKEGEYQEFLDSLLVADKLSKE